MKRREQIVDFIYEQLVNDRIQRVRDKVDRSRRAHEARLARRAGRPSRITRVWRRVSQPVARHRPAGGSPVPIEVAPSDIPA